MALINPPAARTFFRAPPLTLVVCQLQYDHILAINDVKYVGPFQEFLRPTYPQVSRVGAIDVVLTSGGVEAKQGPADGWSFAQADGTKSVIVSANALTLEVREYTRWEEVRDSFLAVLKGFIEHVNPGGRTRLGLRYVNRLRFDDISHAHEWTKIVRPELLGLASSAEIAADEAITHSLGQTRFAEEASQLFARYGFLEAGVAPTAGDPPPEEPHFLLDFDHFDARRFPTVDPTAIQAQLEEFHEAIHRLFRWCLTDEGFNRLDPITEREHT